MFPKFSSVAQSCLTLCDPMDCGTPSFPVHHQLLELTQPHVYRVSDASNYLFLCLPLLLLTSIFPTIRVFSNELVHSLLEKGMANHFSILALRTPITVLLFPKEIPKNNKMKYNWNMSTEEIEWHNNTIYLILKKTENKEKGRKKREKNGKRVI